MSWLQAVTTPSDGLSRRSWSIIPALLLTGCAPGSCTKSAPAQDGNISANEATDNQALETTTGWRELKPDWASAMKASQASETSIRVIDEALDQEKDGRLAVPIIVAAPQQGFVTRAFRPVETGYALQQVNRDLDITIEGTTVELGLPAQKGAPPTKAAIDIQTSEDTRSVSFSRFGVNYLITVSCNDGRDPESCAPDERLQNLAKDLKVYLAPQR